MKSFLFIFLWFAPNAMAESLYPVKIAIQGGAELRVENTVNPELKEGVPYSALGIFLNYKQFGLLQEITYSRSSSSLGNLNVKVSALEWNQWVQYLWYEEATYNPYFAAGVGLSQNEVVTRLISDERKDKSRIYLNGGFSFGLVMSPFSRLDFLAEARAWKFEQKKDPIFSGLFGVRFWL